MATLPLSSAPYPAPVGVVFRAGRAVGGAICPRCPIFIASGSRVVRLIRPELPDTLDGRHDRRTGRPYHSTGKPIDATKPRWWVHERCAIEGEVRDVRA